MPLWRLYYHLVWATRDREPLVTAEIEADLHHYITGKAHSLGSIIHAIGGLEDHLHLIASIPPKLAISEFVKGIKGSSAHHLNHHVELSVPAFAWQHGYGVFSLGGRQMPDALEYVAQQREHHLKMTLRLQLESCGDEEDGPKPWRHMGRIVVSAPLS